MPNSSECLCKNSQSALSDKRTHFILWPAVVLGFFADYITKYFAVKHLSTPPSSPPRIIWLIQDYLGFQLTGNAGAVWGLAHGKTTFLIIMAVVALVAMTYVLAGTRRGQHWAHLAIGLIAAGALGNLVDRIFNRGQVIDFIRVDLHFWPADPWPIFNIADIWICLGVGILLLMMLRGKLNLGSTAQSPPKNS